MSIIYRVQQILNQLKQSPFWTEVTTENDAYLSGLLCPKCGQAEAFTYKSRPYSIYCNRRDNCGAITPVRDLFPDPVTDIERDFPPNDEDPHRPATEYLSYRGLSERSLEGLDYRYWRDVRGTGSGAIMFPVPTSTGETAFNGRIFNPPKGEGKTHNQGSCGASVWRHPGLQYDQGKPTYVTEGVIDALSLIEMGYQAVAVLTAGRNPEKVDMTGLGQLVFAFDNDDAGKKATRRFVGHYKRQGNQPVEAILPVNGDWNEFLLRHGPGQAAAEFEKQLPEFGTEANLALARTAREYAQILEKNKHFLGLFEFERQLYFSYLKGKGDTAIVAAKHLGDFNVQTMHYQHDSTVQDRPVNKYHIKVRPKRGRSVTFTATAQELASPQGLRQLLLERARVLWKGEREESLALVERLLSPAPVVRQLNMSGYDPQTQCYVFKHHMIDTNGELVRPDAEGFYKVSAMDYVRPAPHDTISPADGVDVSAIMGQAFEAWGDKARAALAWTVASWFVNQIKAQIGLFPFLSLYGPPQTGKTNLDKNLNAFQCYDEEGLPMRKVNTAKGEVRTIAQRSGAFTALLEWPPGDKARFELDNILTLYNNNPFQNRAKKSMDLETEKIPFYGALMFVQNTEPFKEIKHKERVVSLEFRLEDLTPETRQVCEELQRTPLGDKAAVFTEVMANRLMIEAQWHNYYDSAVEDLRLAGVSARLQETHGIVLGFYNLLDSIFQFNYDLSPFIIKIAQEKARQCEERQETAADRFLDILMTMIDSKTVTEDDSEVGIDTSGFLDTAGDHLFVHRTEAEKAIRLANYALNYSGEQLTQSLHQHPAFVESGKQHRFNDHNQRAYVFSWPMLVTNVH